MSIVNYGNISGTSTRVTGKRKVEVQKVLVDYDGVVLRSSSAGQLIGRRCAEFTKKVVGLGDVDKAAVVNAGLYRHYGHTVIGLRSLGYDVSVRDFNKAVYSGINYDQLGLGEHDFDMSGLLKMYKLYPESWIFSSAPDDWIIGTLGVTGIGRKLLDRIRIARPSDVEVLKPDVRAFSNCGIEGINGEGGIDKITLIDDNLMNVQSAARIEGWRCLWVNMNAFRLSDKITCVRNLEDALFTLSLPHTV